MGLAPYNHKEPIAGGKGSFLNVYVGEKAPEALCMFSVVIIIFFL